MHHMHVRTHSLCMHAGEPRETAMYTGEPTGLKDFIMAEKLPLTIEFTQQNTDKIFSSGINKQVSAHM